MGCEFAQTSEWNFKAELPWALLQHKPHQGVQKLVRDLNKLYTTEKAMYEYQYESKGFEWIDYSNHEASIIAYVRKTDDIDDDIVVLCNFNSVLQKDYRIGVPKKGNWKVLINTDDEQYGGSGSCPDLEYETETETCNGKAFSILASLPPLGVLVLKNDSA